VCVHFFCLIVVYCLFVLVLTSALIFRTTRLGPNITDTVLKAVWMNCAVCVG